YVAIEKIWRENHVLVMPSRFEGMPMTIVEAMVCGRPVVATNVGLSPEIIKDGVTGFLAEAAVTECYGRALERMWAQRHRLEEIGNLAAADIRDFIPDDPVVTFADKLKSLANLQRKDSFDRWKISITYETLWPTEDRDLYPRVTQTIQS